MELFSEPSEERLDDVKCSRLSNEVVTGMVVTIMLSDACLDTDVWGCYFLAVEKYSPLMIDCYYLDYSGSKYDCVAEKFLLKPFEGEVAITFLEVYPMRFVTQERRADGKTLEEFLIDRGRKFIELTEVSHKRYEGLTLGESREEVSKNDFIMINISFTDKSIDEKSGHRRLCACLPAQ